MAKKNIDEKLRENDLNGFGLSQENFSTVNKTKLENLSKADIGLNLVDNTPDSQKEVSVPQQEAINSKFDSVENAIPLGPYDASTNSPTLSSIPSISLADGSYYDLVSSGILNFSGINFQAGIIANAGDKLKKQGAQWYLIPFDVDSFYDVISKRYFADVKPSVIAAGSVLTNPNSLTCYIAPAGTYTVPAGTITLSGNLNLIFWDFDSGWTYTSFDVAVKDNTVTTSKISDGAVTTAKIADGAVTDAKINSLGSLFRILSYIIIENDDTDLQVTDLEGNVAFQIDGNGLQYWGKFTEDTMLSILGTLFYIYQGNNVEICDDEGNVNFRVDSQGLDYYGKLTESSIFNLLRNNFGIQPEITDDLEICDEEGNVTVKISKTSGLDYYGKLTKEDITVTTVPEGRFLSDFNQIIVYGQSLSVGGTFAQQVDFYDTKTFAGGVLINYDPDISNAANSYFGSSLIDLPRNGSEGGQAKGIAKIWKELLRDENKIPIAIQDTTFIVNSAGAGGLSWSQCVDVNGDYYRRLLESVRRGKDFAIAQGKTYNVPILAYVQGENSADKADSITTFYNKLDTLFAQLNTDIKGITGQNNDVQFLTYQIASFPNNSPASVNVPLAQLKIALEKSNVHFGCAMYQMDYADLLHVTSTSYRVMGALMGIVAKRAVTDNKKMLPISPISWSTQVNSTSEKWILQMKMNVPVTPLVFDTSVNSKYTVAPTNFGFSILNGSAEIIESVTIKRGDTLNFVCTQNPTGKTLTYAIQGVYSGGNLRDSQGNTLSISCEGINQPLHNWCPIFQQVI